MATIRTATKAIKSAPPAPKAPSAPKAPTGFGPAPKGKAAVMAPVMTSAVKRGPGRPPALPKAPSAPTVPVAAAKAPPPNAIPIATLKEIESLKGEIARLTAQATKAKALNTKKEQSKADIIGDDETRAALTAAIAANPNAAWMLDYAGDTYPLASCMTRNADDFIIEDMGTIPNLMTFCAIPRDSDLGGYGAVARLRGNMALHTVTNERGNYTRTPVYVSANDFYALLRVTAGEQLPGLIDASGATVETT